jgi:SPP1 family predicted phage head-tail adaptor
MRAGRLSNKVKFQRAVETANSFGEMIKTWEDIVEAWASVDPMRGGERFAALQVQANIDTRITVRWQSALSTLGPADRIVFGKKIYDIRAIINVHERNKELQIMCQEHL